MKQLSSIGLTLIMAAAARPGVEAQPSPPWVEPAGHNLLELAAAQDIKPISGPDQNMFLYAFTRAGLRRNTVVLTPGAIFNTGHLAAVPHPTCASLFVGMPFNLGDGAVFTVSYVLGKHESEAVRLMIDPAHERLHRAWIPLRIPLSKEQSTGGLRFRVSEGARGDSTGDWVGIAPGTETECSLSVSLDQAAGKN